jgi:Caspase domain/Agenet domain
MATQRALGWSPGQTWLFVVGTLEWKHGDLFSPFPKERRRDALLVDFFRAQGVPAAQIVYLTDRQATTARVQQAFEEHLAKARAGETLLVYYCGHGGQDDAGSAYFASYDTDCDSNWGWMVDTITETIARRFRGSRALLLADCCHSGSLADSMAKRATTIGYACLASSLSSELSTGNWTFTEGLLAGLAGHAYVDADGDHVITLRELAEQIAETMAFAEEQIVTFATHGPFDPDLVIAAARPRPDPRVGRHVAVLTEGEWYRAEIVATDGQRLKVHYYGYEESDDEWVASDQTRSVSRPSYPAGATVAVQWRRKWYLATIRAVRAGIHYVEYEGHGPEWNEWVALSRIRPIA